MIFVCGIISRKMDIVFLRKTIIQMRDIIHCKESDAVEVIGWSSMRRGVEIKKINHIAKTRFARTSINDDIYFHFYRSSHHRQRRRHLKRSRGRRGGGAQSSKYNFRSAYSKDSAAIADSCVLTR